MAQYDALYYKVLRFLEKVRVAYLGHIYKYFREYTPVVEDFNGNKVIDTSIIDDVLERILIEANCRQDDKGILRIRKEGDKTDEKIKNESYILDCVTVLSNYGEKNVQDFFVCMDSIYQITVITVEGNVYQLTGIDANNLQNIKLNKLPKKDIYNTDNDELDDETEINFIAVLKNKNFANKIKSLGFDYFISVRSNLSIEYGNFED